jgi:hypothetical protein
MSAGVVCSQRGDLAPRNLVKGWGPRGECRAVVDEEAIGAKLPLLAGQLDERGLWLRAAAEAERHGRAGPRP